MSYTAVENTPISVNLIQAAKDTGWSVPGDGTAVHEICNAGYLRDIFDFLLVNGKQYNITYQVISISGGYVTFGVGADGVHNSTTGFKQETITASGDLRPYFYSNANCVIKGFNIQEVLDPIDEEAENTIAFSEQNKKWIDFRSFAPDCGFSLFTNTYVFENGVMYKLQNGSQNRNNFFGTQYNSRIQFVDAKQPLSIKSFESISVQSNALLITTTDGITTSLGQVSELGAMDFLKDNLNDGTIQVSVYNKEGVYSACFLRDGNENLYTGSPLKGNYITIELTTTDDNSDIPVQLFSIQVVASISKIGAR